MPVDFVAAGKTLRAAQKALNMQQKAFARYAGVTARTVLRWERGQSTGERRNLDSFVRVLTAVDPAWGRRVSLAYGVAYDGPAPPIASTATTVASGPEAAGETRASVSVEEAAARTAHAAFLAAEAVDMSPRIVRRALAVFAAELATSGVPLADAITWLQRAP